MGQNQKVVFDSDDDFEETARAAESAVKADELQRAEMAALAGDDTTDLEEEDDMEPETVSISRGKEELVVMQQSRKMAIQSQQEVQKRKRKEKEDRIRQVKQSSKKSRRITSTEQAAPVKNDVESNQRKSDSGLAPLPAELLESYVERQQALTAQMLDDKSKEKGRKIPISTGGDRDKVANHLVFPGIQVVARDSYKPSLEENSKAECFKRDHLFGSRLNRNSLFETCLV